MEERKIDLPNGSSLEVSLTSEFLEIVKNHFSLESTAEVTDGHVQHYLAESLRSAIQKEESKAFYQS
jgi:hypothetical protein|tara:strand:- start:540 stop:740 length:201 start_codon:yes stop_codon:yes gene_type:complete